MQARNYDVVVLGGGIGGYIAAIRASQLGMSAAIIEKDKLGGTCLHRGCIPSKALLRSAEIMATVNHASEFGIQTAAAAVNFLDVQARKTKIVEQLYHGVQYLMKKHKIEVIAGVGRVSGPSIFSPRSGAVAVQLPDGEAETIVPKHLIIATGSRPRTIPGLEVDGRVVMTSDDALNMEKLPESVLIVGGGVIGVEWASLLHDFGVQVTIVEALPRLVANEDEEVSREMERLLKKRGIKVLTEAKLLTERTRVNDNHVTAIVEHKGETVDIAADKLLLSIGRQANVEGIGLENTDIRVENGFIQVNRTMQTTESHIYAVGDVTGGLQLAHAASGQAIVAVEHFAGLQPIPYDPLSVSRCIYTRQEAAAIGLTERQATDQGIRVKIGKFPFQSLGKAIVQGETDGFVKVIVDAGTDDILGVHIIGPQATNLIANAALGRLLDATPWEYGRLIHPHPTLSEVLGEAMLAVDGLSLAQ